MLKGTTTIELTDVKTGEKQTVTEHNMITNAMTNLFQPTFGHLTNEATLRGYIPAYKTLLGGIFLFNNSIPEDANCIYAPAGRSLTGCGRFETVNTSTGLVLGSYNVTESEYNSTQRKMKFVYDFNTSQGNGVIASVCLTNVDCGYGTYNSDMTYSVYAMKQCHTVPKDLLVGSKDMYSGVSTGSYYHLFTIDAENDIGYYFSLPTGNTLRIQTRQTGLRNFSLFSTSMPILDTLDDITLGTSIGAYRTYNFDRDDSSLYIISTDASTIASNATFVVTKVEFGTWTVTQYTMSNTTGTTLYSSSRFGIVHRGQVYMRNNSSYYRVYKLELGNAANVVRLDGSTSYAVTPVFAVGGRTYWQYDSYSSGEHRVYVTDEVANELNFSGTAILTYYSYSRSYYVPSYVPVLNHEMFYYLSVGSTATMGFYYLAAYLATINNLSEPVTKTADKTMKITYTIEEQ